MVSTGLIIHKTMKTIWITLIIISDTPGIKLSVASTKKGPKIDPNLEIIKVKDPAVFLTLVPYASFIYNPTVKY